jgi:hypothetical protein
LKSIAFPKEFHSLVYRLWDATDNEILDVMEYVLEVYRSFYGIGELKKENVEEVKNVTIISDFSGI